MFVFLFLASFTLHDSLRSVHGFLSCPCPHAAGLGFCSGVSRGWPPSFVAQSHWSCCRPAAPRAPAGRGLSYGWFPQVPSSGPGTWWDAHGGGVVLAPSQGDGDVSSGARMCLLFCHSFPHPRERMPGRGQIRKSTGGHRPEKVQGGARRCLPGGRVPALGAEAVWWAAQGRGGGEEKGGCQPGCAF